MLKCDAIRDNAENSKKIVRCDILGWLFTIVLEIPMLKLIFLKAVVHVIIPDQWHQTARLYEI